MRPLLAWLAPLPLAAHMVSLSTGEIRIEQDRAEYELRLPLYEVAHIRNPETALFESIRFRSGGAEAQLAAKTCRADAAAGSYVCNGSFRFAGPVAALEVECRLPSVTVANHVHLLRARMDGKSDQAVLDLSFPAATLRFRPPTAGEIAVTHFGAGLLRAAGGAAQILFLGALALAGRKRRELIALAAAFLAGQIVSCLVTAQARWQPAPRFVEAAAALTIAYLAVEMLLLPEAGKRWLVAGVLGAFHGLYFALFLRQSEYHASYFLAGVVAADAALIAVFAAVVAKARSVLSERRPVQVAATALLAIGMAWFFLRLRG